MKLIKKLLSAVMILALPLAITACTQRGDEPITHTPTAEQAEQGSRPIDWTTRAATAIAAGAYSSFVIQADGILWGWGIFGEIEFDEEGTRLPPHQPHLIPVKLMEEVDVVSAGGWYSGSHVMALQSNGSLWGLGDNSYGKLGDGTTKAHNDFIKVMDDVIAISTGGSHTMAILTDGTLWAWGGNWHGQLGDGTTTDRHIPVKIMDNVIAVSAGITHTMAITADNVLWGWGHNGSGRLGYSESAHELNPVHPNPIRIMDDVAAVSAGGDHTLAIKTDGSLWAWGNNSWGVLGGGPIEMPHNRTFSHTPIPTPNPIIIMDDVKAISAGDDYSMAVTSDGALWAWGFNSGWVTLGVDRTDTATGVIDRPMKVMDDVVVVSAWAGHTIAVKADGSVWTWGDNRFGQLGDGTQEERSKPVQISSVVPAGD